mgnify:FL=1
MLFRSLDELSNLVNWPIVVARELTKLHEEFVEGQPSDLVSRFKAPQGEFTILVPPRPDEDSLMNPAEDVTDQDVMDLFCQITENTHFESKKDAARAVGERLGLTAKQVYAILERSK